MSGLHEIMYGQGDQTIVHVPPVRVASATYEIEDLSEGLTDSDRVIGSGSATVDSLSAALTADSGRGTTAPRRINVVAAAERGRAYVIEHDGEAEIVQLEGVSSSHVTAAGPLSGEYPATDAYLRGIELRATFPSAAAARDDLLEEDRPLRVVWTYTLDGRIVRVGEPIRVKRSSADTRYIGRAEQEIRKEWPELVQALPKHGNAVRSLVKACASWVSARLKARNVPPEQFLGGDQGYQVLLARCLWRIGERGHAPGSVDIEQWREEKKADFLSAWRALVIGSPGLDTTEPPQATDQAPIGPSHRYRSFVKKM